MPSFVIEQEQLMNRELNNKILDTIRVTERFIIHDKRTYESIYFAFSLDKQNRVQQEHHLHQFVLAASLEHH